MPDNSALISGKSFLAAFDCIKLVVTADFLDAGIINNE